MIVVAGTACTGFAAGWWRTHPIRLAAIRRGLFMLHSRMHVRRFFARAAGALAVAAALMTVPLPSMLRAQVAAADALLRIEADAPPRPGDILRLRIWQEDDLSGDFLVEETGMVTLPRIGPIPVTAETPASLRSKVIAAYEEFLLHSSISVQLLRRVQILGAVKNPGLYPVDATMTLADAIALAGGPTVHGKSQSVELVRNGRRVATRLSTETPIANSSLRSGDQIFVPERSWISRNATVVSAALTASVSLTIALLRR
jgi:protein involved in polysaccharide export with SLBB domain